MGITDHGETIGNNRQWKLAGNGEYQIHTMGMTDNCETIGNNRQWKLADNGNTRMHKIGLKYSVKYTNSKWQMVMTSYNTAM